MRVLVVEDDNALAASMRLILSGNNWIVHRCRTGGEAIHYIKSLSLDVVTLDMGLPDMDGFKVLRALPERSKRPPIICVSGLDPVEMRVAALRAGAADYIVKPFHPSKLLARIHAVTRRYEGRAENIVEIGKWRIFLEEQAITWDGRNVNLPRILRMIVMVLARQPGHVFSNEDIVTSVWDSGFEPDAHAASVYIFKLREKFRLTSGGDALIECIRQRGYMMKPSPTLYRTGKKSQPVYIDDGRDWFERLGLDASLSKEPVA